MKRSAAEEGRKLLRVSLFILRKYLSLLRPSSSTRDFFTDVYLRYVLGADRDWGLPCWHIGRLFPGIEATPIQTYITFASHRAGAYSDKTSHLTSPLENQVLCSLCKFLRPQSLFEFGTFKGWTTANLALNLPLGSQIITFDLYPLETGDEMVDRCFVERKIQRIQGDSLRYDFSAHARSFDFIFIDGDHSAEGVKSDTENALNMLSPRGTIVWHDYNPEHPDVLQYLNQLAEQLPIFHIAGTCLAIYSRDSRFKSN